MRDFSKSINGACFKVKHLANDQAPVNDQRRFIFSIASFTLYGDLISQIITIDY